MVIKIRCTYLDIDMRLHISEDVYTTLYVCLFYYLFTRLCMYTQTGVMCYVCMREFGYLYCVL